VKSGLIVGVEAARAMRRDEVGAAKTMLERTEDRFDMKLERQPRSERSPAEPLRHCFSAADL